MKSLLLLCSLFTATVCCPGCVPADLDTESSKEDQSMMDHSMMGHDMDSMMVQSDEDFLSMMIPHHQEAIDTANVILAKSENADLKALAQDIVDAQTAEIAQMETWGKEWFGEDFKASDDYEPMMPDLSTLEGEELDQAFIEGMIEHHQMAIMMAMQVQMISERTELLDMADAIIDAQTAEIQTMKGWLK